MSTRRKKKPVQSQGGMLFPWGDYERIFPPGSQISEGAYQEVYHMLNHEVLYWSLILQDTANCVDSIITIVGFEMVTVEKHSLTRAIGTIKRCLALDDDRLIPIIIHQVSLSSGSYWRDSAPVKLEGTSKIVWDIKISGRHANMLIIDKKHKTVEYFEPHGTTDDYDDYLSDKSQMMKDALQDVLPKDYTYIDPSDLCPTPGPQRDEPLCFAWGLLYFHLRMKNPHMTGKQITAEMVKETKIGPPLVYDWLDVMHNTLEELEYEYSSYSDKTKKELKRLQLFLAPKGADEIAAIIATNRYLPVPSENDFYFQAFQRGEALFGQNDTRMYVYTTKTKKEYESLQGRPLGHGKLIISFTLPKSSAKK